MFKFSALFSAVALAASFDDAIAADARNGRVNRAFALLAMSTYGFPLMKADDKPVGKPAFLKIASDYRALCRAGKPCGVKGHILKAQIGEAFDSIAILLDARADVVADWAALVAPKAKAPAAPKAAPAAPAEASPTLTPVAEASGASETPAAPVAAPVVAPVVGSASLSAAGTVWSGLPGVTAEESALLLDHIGIAGGDAVGVDMGAALGESVELDVSAMVESVIDAIGAGLLTDDECEALQLALHMRTANAMGAALGLPADGVAVAHH